MNEHGVSGSEAVFMLLCFTSSDWCFGHGRVFLRAAFWRCWQRQTYWHAVVCILFSRNIFVFPLSRVTLDLWTFVFIFFSFFFACIAENAWCWKCEIKSMADGNVSASARSAYLGVTTHAVYIAEAWIWNTNEDSAKHDHNCVISFPKIHFLFQFIGFVSLRW